MMERIAFHVSLALTAALAAQSAIARQQDQALGSGGISESTSDIRMRLAKSRQRRRGARRYRLKGQKLEIL
jgi:hypothetical protein